MSNPTKQQSTMKKFIKWGAIALGALLLIGLIGSAIAPSKPKPQIVSKVVTHTVIVLAPGAHAQGHHQDQDDYRARSD
jgi:hypothetical protein